MRRKFVVLAVLCVLLLGFVTLASAQEFDVPVEYDTPAIYEALTGRTIEEFKEAPELSERVAAGELEPVEKRLPLEPRVVDPVEEIGQYGGNMRRAWLGPSDRWCIRHFIGEPFITTTVDAIPVPNVAKGWEILDNNRVFVFYMREGMRWSDGHPVTSADAEFWWAIKTDPRGYHPHSDWMLQNGEAGTLKVIDEYTFQISFPEPNTAFLLGAAGDGRARMLAPKHYLEQFHPDYADPDELERMVSEGGFDSWQSLFDNKYQWPEQNPERPTIAAWYPISEPTDPQFIFVRNPYYWKVDTAGNQLPYIDRMTYEYVQDPAMIEMRAITGQIDFQGRGVGDISVLMENRDAGDYRVLLYPNVGHGSSLAMYFNQNSKKPVTRALLTDVRFRRALSAAINREEINEVLYYGLQTPRQASFSAGSPFYDPEWTDAYVQYDPELANQLLDEMGLAWGSGGYRINSDGSRVSIFAEDADGSHVEELEMITAYWKDVGVQLHINTPERSLFEERTTAGEFDIAVWGYDRALRPDVQPRWWVAGPDSGGYHWGPLWNRWYATSGERGEEPPEEIKHLQQILSQVRTAEEFDTVVELMAEATKFHRENLFVIGTVGEGPAWFVAKNNVRNAPNKLPYDAVHLSPSNVRAFQLFFKK